MYAILTTDQDGFDEEHVIESDNRGVKGGLIPPHVLRYGHEYARRIQARRLRIDRIVPALVTGEGVVRIEQRQGSGSDTYFSYDDNGNVISEL